MDYAKARVVEGRWCLVLRYGVGIVPLPKAPTKAGALTTASCSFEVPLFST